MYLKRKIVLEGVKVEIVSKSKSLFVFDKIFFSIIHLVTLKHGRGNNLNFARFL